MATIEAIPDDITKLIEKNKDKSIKAEDRKKLIQWIIGMKKIEGWSLRSLLKKDFDYSETEYNTLANKVRRFEKKLKAAAAEQLKELEKEDFSKFLENLWGEANKIAKKTLMRWYNTAVEYGYYDEETETVRVHKFLEAACNFFVEKSELVRGYESQILDLEATASMFADLSKPNVLRLIAFQSYVEFTSRCVILAAKGIPVPEAIIAEVRNTVNNIIFSTHPAIKEMLKP